MEKVWLAWTVPEPITEVQGTYDDRRLLYLRYNTTPFLSRSKAPLCNILHTSAHFWKKNIN